MAAIGPDFKTGYADALPVNNADVGITIAQLMGLRAASNGGLTGRVVSEALPNGIVPKAADGTIRKLHAKSIGENSVHGSDAAETAAIEIAQFFSGNEIVG